MEFLSELKKINSSIKDLPYGEVVNFAQNVSKRVEKEISELNNTIEEIKKNYIKFGELFTAPTTQIPSQLKIMKINVGGVCIECPVIEEYKDTLKYPYKPCVFSNVGGWFFIAFPELGQILPVSEVEGILEYKQDLKYTKIHYALYKKMPMETTLNSDFAVYPHNKQTWELFNKINKNSWSKYLKQVKICQLSASNKLTQRIPIYSTKMIGEISTMTEPESMGVEWSLFVQLYFLLYVFRQKAKHEHFTI